MPTRQSGGSLTRRALVTGATSGIGAAFARLLADDGWDLVLVAEDATAARQLSGNHEVLLADLKNPSQLASVEQRLAAGDVALLVNNAGFGVAAPFWEADVEELSGQVDVMVTAVMRLTHAAVRAMRARGTGAVINVASMNALLSTRGSTYPANKSWVVSFTRGLSDGLAGSGVKILVACPGYTRTAFHERAGIASGGVPGFAWLDADQVAAQAMKDLRKGKVMSVPGTFYRAVALMTEYVPRPLMRLLARHVFRM